jgi:hypothetical protein
VILKKTFGTEISIKKRKIFSSENYDIYKL